MKAIIYTRYSPQRDGEDKESCEVQEAYCRKLAESKGYEVVGVFADPEASGADEYRQKLWDAISALPKGGVLIVYKRDRLARNVYLSEQINRAVHKRDGRVEAVSGDVDGDGPEHVMIRQVLAAIAEYERKLIASRTSHAMRHHQAGGKRMSRFAPYGWRINPKDKTKMIPDETEVEAVQAIHSMHDEGLITAEIVRRMNASVYPARSGEWNFKTVQKIIRERRKVG